MEFFLLKKVDNIFSIKTTDLNYKEINRTGPSASVRVPWTNSLAYFATAAMTKWKKFMRLLFATVSI
jgi:hypothetical protein